MNYQEYEILFTIKAREVKKDDEYIQRCLSYAKPLFERNLPVIFDSDHFSMQVGYTRQYIKHAVEYIDYYYWDYKIKKKNGQIRIIKEPFPNLKDIQLWILHNILYKFTFHPYAKAYVPKKNIRDNVRFHTKKKKVLTLDIHDFFSSVKIGSIKAIFLNFGYADWVSDLLAKLCCLNRCLPQGAPTSPALSNIFLYDFDEKLKAFCLDRHIMYTRYADDMTFSGDFDDNELIQFVKLQLGDLGLSLNEDKTHLMLNTQRQLVTGCIVNQRTHLPSEQLRDIRQEIYYIKKFGLESHKAHEGISRLNYIKHLYGRINYALVLQPGNKEMKEYKKYLWCNFESLITVGE